MPESLIRAVVQIQMGHLHIAGRQRLWVDAKAMILRGDLHLLGQQILHRMIRPVMPELQLESLPAQR